MEIRLLGRAEFEKYNEFIISFPESLVYSGIRFREFLEKETGAEPHYLVVIDHDAIIGALPLFIKDGFYGRVVNSLPFYGSNGGILTENKEAKRILLEYYKSLVRYENIISSTIVVSPFEEDREFYMNNLKIDFVDERIGQVTFLPPHESSLMEMFHVKTRNSVRKGLRNCNISWERGLDYLDFLFETHRENISSLGGLWKSRETINNLVGSFGYGSDLRIYTALCNSKPVAALLCLYFNRTVEYYIPAVKSEHRGSQIMSGIIYRAMSDSISSGFKYWNWGGTWPSQKGVYTFKERWGTRDMPYSYFISLNNGNRILYIPKDKLLSEYKYFYIVPFK